MMTLLTYPEHHNTWLSVMGVVRWQSRKVNVDFETGNHAWPQQMQQAHYWVLGEHPLDEAAAYLLAGMMAAIGAMSHEVMYITVMDDSFSSITTTLAKFPSIQMHGVSADVFNTDLVLPNNVHLLVLGAVQHVWQSQLQHVLPSLEDMLAQPQLKREAWTVLKRLL